MKVAFQFMNVRNCRMFRFAGGLVGVFFSPVPRFAPAKLHPFIDAVTVASQLLEWIGFSALSDNRSKLGMLSSVWMRFWSSYL